AKQELDFPAPKPEGRLPGFALVLISLLVVALAYGGWYYWTQSDRPFVELLPEPEEEESVQLADEQGAEQPPAPEPTATEPTATEPTATEEPGEPEAPGDPTPEEATEEARPAVPEEEDAETAGAPVDEEMAAT